MSLQTKFEWRYHTDLTVLSSLTKPEAKDNGAGSLEKANGTFPRSAGLLQPFGNSPRNSVRGPLFWQVDAVASKPFALAGTFRVEFRIELFNLLNRTNFRAPTGNRSAAGFGTITSTFDPRPLQLDVKLLWQHCKDPPTVWRGMRRRQTVGGLSDLEAGAWRVHDTPCATMCYMNRSTKVGVRELRQNLSVHLARVIAGETLEVTDRGQSVAVLAPLVHGESSLARLKREGRLISATTELLAGRRARGPAPGTMARALQRERDDRT